MCGGYSELLWFFRFYLLFSPPFRMKGSQADSLISQHGRLRIQVENIAFLKGRDHEQRMIEIHAFHLGPYREPRLPIT